MNRSHPDTSIGLTFVPGARIKKTYMVCTNTLRAWADDGKIAVRHLPGGKRLYCAQDVDKLLGGSGDASITKACLVKKEILGYARVSSTHQKADLERQVQLIKAGCPGIDRMLTDIGSGINFKRKGLQALLDACFRGVVSQVVVLHRDRLCRFAYDLLDCVIRKTGTQIMVLDTHTAEDGDGGMCDARELADDLLAITCHFVARNNGMRSAEHRRKRKASSQETEEGGKTAPKSRRREEQEPQSTSRSGSERSSGSDA